MTNRTTATRALVIAALLAGTFTGSAASAGDGQSEATGADAKVPFEAGRALVRAGRFAEAIREFEASVAIRPTVGAYLNLGDCNEKIGHYTSAIAAFEKAARSAEAAGEPARAVEARARGERLKPTESSVVLRPAADMQSAKFLLDGTPIEAGVARPVDGGEHTVIVKMTCRLDHELRVNVGLNADAHVVTLASTTLRADPACAPAAPVAPVPQGSGPPRPHEDPRAEKSSGPSPLVMVLGGSGLVLLGLGTAFAIDVAGKKSDLDDACSSYPKGCPAARRGELDDLASGADRSATFATIGVLAGVALVGTAVALHLFVKPAARSAAASPSRTLRFDF